MHPEDGFCDVKTALIEDDKKLQEIYEYCKSGRMTPRELKDLGC